ncbi:MAG: HDIG domain-containing protein [bacterium]|nr:HDIG domain-containing protein [bacterium]
MAFAKQSKKKSRGGASYQTAGSAWRFTPGERRAARIAIGLAFLVLVTAVTQRLVPYADKASREVDFEAIPHEDYFAEFQFDSEDVEATNKARAAAAAEIENRYYVAWPLVFRQLAKFESRVDAIAAQQEGVDKAIQAALLASTSKQDANDVVREAVAAYAAELAKEHDNLKDVENLAKLGMWLDPDPASIPKRVEEQSKEGQDPPADGLKTVGLEEPEVKPLVFHNLPRLTDMAKSSLEYVLRYGVMDPRDRAEETKTAPDRPIVIRRDQPSADQEDTDVLPLAKVPVPAEARGDLLDEQVQKAVQRLSRLQPDKPLPWDDLRAAAIELARADVDKTLEYDEAATEGDKIAARKSVKPVTRVIRRNAKIQGAGDPWGPQQIKDYETMMSLKEVGQQPIASAVGTLLSHMLLVGLILLCLMQTLPLLTGKHQSTYQNLALALLVMCATIVVGRVVYYFDPSGLVTPLAAGAILLAILSNARLAVWTAFLTAALLSIQYDYNWQLLAVNCAMALAGVLSISVVRRRTDITSAALKATVIGLVTMAAFVLATDSLFSENSLDSFVRIVVNGVLCLLIVPAALSPLERLFGVTTDIQLLEYSDLNNEVLSRLSIEVPATYAHSRMLGDLAEAAAASIGANGLLARVCAYYHDIGKLRRPEYFAENQTGSNIHDELSPRLSARAIAAHVSEGAEMAREFHLPKPIIDGIFEHHGTCLISFFYQEALAQAKHDDVRQEDFRYPGPRPQRRETAILMICDAVESGVRSIKNPNEERIRELVDKIVTQRADDRQFDECDITLKDLDTIKEVVTRRMLTSLHGRIAYPDEKREKRTTNVIPMSGGSNP